MEVAMAGVTDTSSAALTRVRSVSICTFVPVKQVKLSTTHAQLLVASAVSTPLSYQQPHTLPRNLFSYFPYFPFFFFVSFLLIFLIFPYFLTLKAFFVVCLTAS